MGSILKLKFTENPVNTITGKNHNDIDFGKVLDQSFDRILLKGHTNYSLYNQMVIDIRNARMKDEDSIDVSKHDLESLKLILIAATETDFTLNRIVSFLTEVIDKTISSAVDNTKPPKDVI